jgi:hypothetical protein
VALLAFGRDVEIAEVSSQRLSHQSTTAGKVNDALNKETARGTNPAPRPPHSGRSMIHASLVRLSLITTR